MASESRTEFSDLPPEIRWEVQTWLAPDVFWDRESRAVAAELFDRWARVHGGSGVAARLRGEFGQNHVQCYRFIMKYDPKFECMIPAEDFRPPPSGRRQIKFGGETTNLMIYSNGDIFVGDLFFNGGILITSDGAKSVITVGGGAMIPDSEPVGNYVIIELTPELFVFASLTIVGKPERKRSRFAIRANSETVTKALISWPRAMVLGSWNIVNPW
jgi:hypothetical protein